MSISKIITPNKRVFVIEFDEKDKSVGGMFLNNHYEPYIQSFLEHKIKDNYICVDIGANFGQHTILMAKLAKQVYAVEPEKRCCKYIRKNIEHNELNNVTLYECGIFNKKGKMNLSFKEDNYACSFLTTTGCKQDNEIIENIEVDTIDNLFLNLPRLDILKIDIEGSEIYALWGGKMVLKKFSPIILIELNNTTSSKFYGINIINVVNELINQGYENIYYFLDNTFLRKINQKEINYIFNTKNIEIIDAIFSK